MTPRETENNEYKIKVKNHCKNRVRSILLNVGSKKIVISQNIIKLKTLQSRRLKTMLMQTFRVTNKEYCGMLWYFLELSIIIFF